MSLKDKILSANDTVSETVEVEEWGVTVEVRTMSGASRAVLLKSAMDDQGELDLGKIYPDIVIGCTFDPETGERVFDTSDRDALMEKSAGALDKVATVAMKLSGFSAKAADEAGKDS